MAISSELLIRIRNFLVPFDFLGHRNGRRAISLQAGLDNELINQVDFEGPTDEFLTLYLEALSGYGKLKDNRDALEAFLVAMKDKVGMDDKALIDEFINSWREARETEWSVSAKTRISPWLFISIAVVIGLGLFYFWSGRRVAPASAPLKEMENPSAFQDYINSFDNDGAAMQQAAQAQGDNSFRYAVGIVESPVEAATKSFTWSLSSRPGLKMSGQAFRVTSQGLNQLSVTSNDDGSLDFTVPECEKGDKLVAVLRVIWKDDPSLKDLEEINHIKQILVSRIK